MSEAATPKQVSTSDLPISAILGLTDRGEADWVRLRGLQYSALAKVSHFRALANIVFALFVVRVFLDAVPFYWLAIWFAAQCALHIRGVILDRSLSDADHRKVTRREILKQASTPLMSGLLWSGAVLFFSPMAGPAELIALLLVITITIAGAVYFNTAPPLGVVVYSGILGLAISTYLALTGLGIVAITWALITLLGVFGSVQVARAHIMARIAESGVAEKEEVVSLLLREFEENEADWLWEIDTLRRLRNVSPRFAFALAASQEGAEGRPLIELIAGKNWEEGSFPPSLHDLAERLKNRENFSNLLVQVTIRGEDRWWELSGTPIRDESGKFTGFRGVGSDVTAQRESTEKIAYLARYDTLTSLPNRLQLTETLGEALRFSQQWRTRCALLMVDLDRFKAVNDSLGHMTGDKLLAQVSARLQSLMDDNQLCGRLAGDEFAIVIRDASQPDVVRRVANDVIAALTEPYQVDQHTLYVGASVGSAVGPTDGSTVEELMRNADLALYRAKDIGGGEHFRFEQSLHASAEERRQLEVSLRKALGRDEFVLHYQPARSENIVSFEALVRWNSEEHGFVSPGKFIPLAEDTRLIVPIGKWVLRQACMEARQWPDHIKVNVNVYNKNKYVKRKRNNNNNRWRHNPKHRKAVPYRNDKVAKRHGGKARDHKRAKSRENFRGRADKGRKDLAKPANRKKADQSLKKQKRQSAAKKGPDRKKNKAANKRPANKQQAKKRPANKQQNRAKAQPQRNKGKKNSAYRNSGGGKKAKKHSNRGAKSRSANRSRSKPKRRGGGGGKRRRG